MSIVIDYPPNFDKILAVFPKADQPGIIFAYDGKIYDPSGSGVPPALIAHETVHLERQKTLGPGPGAVTQWSGPDVWWDQYLRDDEFRYNEELLAHAAEFKMHRHEDRNASASLLMRTALRLTAPLYNYQPPRTLKQALADLQKEIRK